MTPGAPADPESPAIAEVVAELHAQLVHDYPDPPARRDAHPKGHGTVQAEFIVSRSIPADLAHGVFADVGRRYPAYVRFSNCFHIDPDLKADPRGIGVKLLGVQGERLESAEAGETQDFLGATADAFFIPDMRSYVGFPAVAAGDGRGVIPFFIRRRLWRGLRNLGRAALTPAMNPLAIPYFSQTPYRLGAHRIVKFQIRPVVTASLGESLPWLPAFVARGVLATILFYGFRMLKLPRLGEWLIGLLGHPNLLRRALARSLQKSDAWFEFLVQVRETGMLTEDATQRWPAERSPFVRAAWIRIPRQVVSETPLPIVIDPALITDPAALLEDIGEHMAFNPWNGLTAHEPLGSINRGRAHVNAASALYRRVTNRRWPTPPTVAEFDGLAAATRLAPGSIDPRPEPDPFTFGSLWAYWYLRRVPFLMAALTGAFSLASVLVPRVRMFTGGIFDVPRRDLFGVALLTCLLAFTVMTTWWVITAYADRRVGARRCYCVYPVRRRWHVVALLAVAGPLAVSTTIGSGVAAGRDAALVAAIWAGAIALSLAAMSSVRWIADFLGDVPFVKRAARLVGRLPARGSGYLAPESRAFLPGHAQVSVLAALAFAVYVAVGSLAIRETEPRAPALVFLLFIPILGCLVLSALTFFCDRTRVPVLTLVAVALLAVASLDVHTFPLGRVVTDLSVTPRDVLLAPRPAVSASGVRARADTAVIVTASGGGAQAAAWTATVLGGLDALCRAQGCAFGESIALISGTSGGAVGGMLAAQAFRSGHLDATPQQLVDRASSPAENALWRTLVYRDILGPFRRLSATAYDDRGLALERVWQSEMGEQPWLSEFQRDARDGERPGLVVTSAFRSSGVPLLISSAGPVDGRADFFATYEQRDIPVARAARLSAAFPVVVPLARGESGHEPDALVDGGVADLFGVDAAVQWLRAALAQPSRITRVLVLEIETPQDETFSLVFSNRVSEQRRRNALAVENLKLWLRQTVDVRVVPMVLRDEPSIAWHLTFGQRSAIARQWLDDLKGRQAAQVVEFLKPPSAPEP